MTAHNQHNLAIVVTCKLIVVNIFEISLRTYLLTVFSLKLADIKYSHFCLYFFMRALPLNLIFFFVLFIYSSRSYYSISI